MLILEKRSYLSVEIYISCVCDNCFDVCFSGAVFYLYFYYIIIGMRVCLYSFCFAEGTGCLVLCACFVILIAVSLNYNKPIIFVNLVNFNIGLDKAGNTSGKLGSSVNLVNVQKIAGLNTLGISIARLDFAPYGGLNPPHIHPRTTEILTVLEGTLYVGFVTLNPSKLFAKVLQKGDVYVFPKGVVHFQFNIGPVSSVAIAGLSSQNPSLITVANAVFGTNLSISDDVLAKAFQLDKKTVDWISSPTD
ncbi:hypothetical protein LUZ60_010584 [Juncus effusus]|nr:hypothetical protein LUZ60_010584 [Juncus effusus]